MSGKVKDFSEEMQEFLKKFGFKDEDDIVKDFNDYILKEYCCDIDGLLNQIEEGEVK